MHAWEQFLKQQEVELGIETVDKWLRSLKIQRFDACNLYLEAKDSFQALWFEEHVKNKAKHKFYNGNNKPIKIHLSIANNAPPASKNKSKTQYGKNSKEHQFQLSFDDLDPSCTFENFVTSQENELTLKFVKELAGLTQSLNDSLGHFNPIYLYGSSGSGKTHLLMSLAHLWRTKGLKCLYVRAELFTDHVVGAIRAGEMSTFRQAYRNTDILLVDDVHVFSRKGATQEEFFHTFNTLHLEGKQILLSANCSPQELHLIEPRLVSRFEWGIVLPIKTLDSKEKNELLRVKCQALNFSLPSKIDEFLLTTFQSNSKNLIRALEALILRLHIDAQHSSQTLTVTAAKTLLHDLMVEEQKSALTVSKIIQAVAEHHGIRAEDILSKSQTRECAQPRQLAMHFCRAKLKMPYMKIGDLFDRDHSTVMSSIKQIQKSLDHDVDEIAMAWQAINKKLQN